MFYRIDEVLKDVPKHSQAKLFVTHQHLTDRFMADPTILGVIDSYGIELIHPIREGRSEKQIGRKDLSNKR